VIPQQDRHFSTSKKNKKKMKMKYPKDIEAGKKLGRFVENS